MGSIHEVYEEDYKEAINTVCLALEELKDAPVSDGTADGLVAKCREGLDAAQEAIHSLDINAGSQFELNVRVTGYKKDFTRLRKDVDQAEAKVKREVLLMARRDEADSPTRTTREALTHQTARIDGQTERVSEGLRIAQDIEATGQNISTNLHRQREQMERTQDTLYDTDDKVVVLTTM
eukprot:TRINITY_DN3529_c0_g1_i2.p2 TRINITY_DN3529_c0_g1~~TRINITY_DN3529_c0_g1_i2.p2  ORF type:complete len:179 (+),score=62.97 TRINITY_DN3529_c0_g1_i2:1115-1651(+)